MQNVTELEGAALAVIWRHGPCSAYTVMRTFKESRTPEWSAGAGSIYPLVARLEKRGLVAAEQAAWGKGAKKLLRLTPQGDRVFRAWIADLGGKARFLAPDPVRTRMHFIDALIPGSGRDEIMSEAERQARELVEELDEAMRLASWSDPAEELATLGALLAMKARLEWLVAVRRRLGTADRASGSVSV